MSGYGDIGALFAPRNVVLVGASDRNWSPRVYGNLQRFGFAGRIMLVNPNRSELWGEECYPSLADLPEKPDHLALFVPADGSLDILEDAVVQGVRSASLFAAGFGEGGDEKGNARAGRLRSILQKGNIAAIGPNCMGLAVGASKFSTVPDEQHAQLVPGPVAAMTQSGMLVQTVGRGLMDAGLPLSYLLSCGNQIGLSIADFIDYLADDPLLRVIVCYIEAVPDAEAFLTAARKARDNGKTVVAVKIGGSEEVRKAALAHTGSLAGSLEAFDAHAREAGVVRVDSLEDVIEAAKFLSRMPRPKGKRIAVMTNSGALKSLMTQAAEACGAPLPKLLPATREALLTAMPDAEPSNPYDCKRTIPSDTYMACIRALHADTAADVTLSVEELPRAAGIQRKIANLHAVEEWLAAGAASEKPFAYLSAVTLHDTPYMEGLRSELKQAPWMHDIFKTFRTIARLGVQPLGTPGAVRAPDARQKQLIEKWRAYARNLTAPAALDEVTSKEIVSAYGIALPVEKTVADAAAAARAAEAIGYPVVLKAVTPDITHKSDAGLVMIGLCDADEVRRAAETIAERCRQTGARLDGILVAQHVSGGMEMVLGVHRDPEMGPVVMAGMGGVWLELFKDVAFAAPGIDAQGALQAISDTQAVELLRGYRGGKPSDIAAYAAAMAGLGQLAIDFGDSLESVDVNPVLVREAGQGAVALDALVVLRPPVNRP
ncbi:MAG: acetate--CoA ligase family protein [Hyphomicrobiales bacterium]|nr:acetate--CoA ligase family protein [Hyphomicrobiales bacterium]